MKKMSFLSILLLLATFIISCNDPHLLVDPRQDRSRSVRVQTAQFEVLSPPLNIKQTYSEELSELLERASLPGRISLPEKLFCSVEPITVHLVMLKQRINGANAIAAIESYGYKPIDVCTLLALAIEYPDETRNIVALREYKSSTELCARAYINYDTLTNAESPSRIISRRFCSDEFSSNAIFAVTR